VQSEEFNGVKAIAEQLVKACPEAGMFQSHPLAQERQDEDLRKRSIRDAIKQIIDGHPSKPQELKYYVSYPAKVDCHLVCAVLGLQTEVLESYYSLQQDHLQMHECRNIPLSVSLVDATVSEFLDACTEQLTKPDPGLGTTGSDSEVDELVRAAAGLLTNGLVWRIDQDCIEGMHSLFRSLTIISSLRYEKSEGSGRIILARKSHPAIDGKV
jgi:hypothetical protein